jgi:hypothetical protein
MDNYKLIVFNYQIIKGYIIYQYYPINFKINIKINIIIILVIISYDKIYIN